MSNDHLQSLASGTAPRPVPTAPDKPRRFVFLLLDRFSMLSFSSAVECLRIANRMSERNLYAWTLIGEGGKVLCARMTGECTHTGGQGCPWAQHRSLTHHHPSPAGPIIDWH